jgi:hypothetical protein
VGRDAEGHGHRRGNRYRGVAGRLIFAALLAPSLAFADAAAPDLNTTGAPRYSRDHCFAVHGTGCSVTRLPNGKDLVAGGCTENVDVMENIFEIYPDSAICDARGCTATSKMVWPWCEHRAVLLPDGRVLAVGGIWDPFGDPSRRMQLFDPGKARWRAAAPMKQERRQPAVVSLPDGRVLVVGGWGPGGSSLASAEIWDPRTGKWTTTGSMRIPRRFAEAHLLPDHRVLIVGMWDKGESEVWDPRTGRWSSAKGTKRDEKPR